MVGNEAVAMGCQQFFEEQNIPYKIEPLNDINGDVYKVDHMWRRNYVKSQIACLVVWGLRPKETVLQSFLASRLPLRRGGGSKEVCSHLLPNYNPY